MKVYLAAGPDPAIVANVVATLVGLGFDVTNATQPVAEPGRVAARAALDIIDQQIAESAAMLVLGLSDFEVGIRLGQAIEMGDKVHLPAVIVQGDDAARPIPVDVSRTAVCLVASLSDGLAVLESWKTRLNNIPPQYARKAIWTMLQADAARQYGV